MAGLYLRLRLLLPTTTTIVTTTAATTAKQHKSTKMCHGRTAPMDADANRVSRLVNHRDLSTRGQAVPRIQNRQPAKPCTRIHSAMPWHVSVARGSRKVFTDHNLWKSSILHVTPVAWVVHAARRPLLPGGKMIFKLARASSVNAAATRSGRGVSVATS